MTTHEPCNLHGNGGIHYRAEGVPYCKDCEIECLRNLLRQVANCNAAMAVLSKMLPALHRQLLPLRDNGERKWLNKTA